MFTSQKRNLIDLVRADPSRVRHIDGMRAASILLVMAGHVSFYLSLTGIIGDASCFRFVRRIEGGYGVDVFFTISGILIGSIVFSGIQSGRFSLLRFYGRRFLRLAPAHYVTLLVLLLLPVSPLLSNGHDTYLYNVLYVSNWIPLRSQFMAWGWSLAIEEQFYVAFPLLALLVVPRVPRLVPWLIASWTVGASAWLFWLFARHGVDPWGPQSPSLNLYIDLIYPSTMHRSACIACGLLVAHAFTFSEGAWARTARRGAEWSGPLVAVSGLVFTGIVLSGHPLSPATASLAFLGSSHVMVAICAAVVALCLHFGGVPPLRKLLETRLLLPVAKLSYSLYLAHPIVYGLLIESFRASGVPATDANVAFLILACLVGSFASATMLYLFVEKPIMDLRDPTSRARTAPVSLAR